ncbi:hypothetical protein Acr_00g0078420 [Actinidia rufa]|uniref:Uncharacterized protein n=1 Tax=Actinidia rufa TaxID=165716 RepID=A0A7J0DUV8_9ERIC|nr:hypothetical protein Acr_00g0078420 [Actinidia rufa]
MHEEVSMSKYRSDHDIPNNVLIERPRPNEDANTVEGHGSRTRFAYGLSIKSRETGNSELEMTVSGLSLGTMEISSIASNPTHSGTSSTMPTIYLSSLSSLSLLDSKEEVKHGEEINEGEAPIPTLAVVASTPAPVEPISISNSDGEASDLEFSLVLPTVKEEDEHSYSKVVDPTQVQKHPQVQVTAPVAPTPSVEPSLPSSPFLRRRKGKVPEVGTSKRRKWGKAGLVSALTPTESPEPLVVMLPQDVIELAVKDSVEADDKMVMQCIQSLFRAMANAKHLKKHSLDFKQAQNDEVPALATIEVEAARNKMAKAQDLAKLQKVAQVSMYQQVFDRSFHRAGDHYTRQVAEIHP